MEESNKEKIKTCDESNSYFKFFEENDIKNLIIISEILNNPYIEKNDNFS